MRVLAVASGKGGVGKTAVAVHIAGGFAAEGKRVLLVDLDHGAHASTWLIGGRAEVGIAEALLDEQLGPEHVIEVPERPGLFLSPASAGLATVHAHLADKIGRERILRDVVRAGRSPQFDIVVLDCPPGVGFLPQSAVHAADKVIVPVLVGFLGISGLLDIRKLVDEVRRRGRVRVELMGSVVFAADERERVTENTRESLRALKDEHVFKAEVRVSTAGKTLPETRALAFDPGADARGAEDYASLLRETETRLAR
jgi:chromosome partitioning protein